MYWLFLYLMQTSLLPKLHEALMQVYLAATCTLAITYNTKDDEDMQPA